MHWDTYTRDALNLLLHVSALHGCLHQTVFTAVKVVLSKRSVVCSTHLHSYKNLNYNTEESTHKMLKCLSFTIFCDGTAAKAHDLFLNISL